MGQTDIIMLSKAAEFLIQGIFFTTMPNMEWCSTRNAFPITVKDYSQTVCLCIEPVFWSFLNGTEGAVVDPGVGGGEEGHRVLVPPFASQFLNK